MALQDPSHAAAARLRVALLALTAVAMLVTAWVLLRGGAELVRVLATWPRHDAVLIHDHLPDTIALELHAGALEALPALAASAHDRADAEGRVRVQLPRPRYLLTPRLFDLAIAYDPADPSRVHVLDPGHLGLPLLAQALLLTVLGGVARGLARSDWGEDRTWVDGRWVPTATQVLRPGRRARPEQTLWAPAGPPRPARFWFGVFAVAAAAAAWGVWRYGTKAPAEVSAGLAAGTLALAALGAGAGRARSRHVRFDDDGVADGDWFSTRRLPWQAIASLQAVNINRSAQAHHDRTPAHLRPQHRMRPATIWEWVASDAQGRELFRLPREAEEAPAFAAFARRCGVSPRRGHAAGLDRDAVEALGPAAELLDDGGDDGGTDGDADGDGRGSKPRS